VSIKEEEKAGEAAKLEPPVGHWKRSDIVP
jgi:hypothetical protein